MNPETAIQKGVEAALILFVTAGALILLMIHVIRRRKK